MEPPVYTRVDHRLTATLEPPSRRGGATRVVVTDPAGETWTTRLGPDGSVALRGLAKSLSPPVPPKWMPATIHRVVLDIPPALAAAAWEPSLRSWADGWVIVRSNLVPPSYATRPLAPPLRIARVALRGSATTASQRAQRDLTRFLDHVTDRARKDFREEAVATMASMADRLDKNIRRRRWPTVDVLEIDADLPVADPTNGRDLDTPGSIGWIERVAARYQVRLIVVPVATPSAWVAPRRLASQVVERGGPAVVLASPDRLGTEDPYRPGLRQLYAGLVHDQPLDIAIERVPDAELFAGAGREEALRVSAGTKLVVERSSGPEPSIEDLLGDVGVRGFGGAKRRMIDRRLSHLMDRWPDLDYSHEGHGLYPAVHVTVPLRRIVEPRLRARRRRAKRPRIVNAAISTTKAGAEPSEEIDPRGQALSVGTEYLLRVDVGALVERTRAHGALELLVEDQLWDPTQDGASFELAVNGVGFEVLGSAVQPMWVPRSGASEPRFVRIRTAGTPGVAVLRYSLYHHDNLVQSFRLAAIVRARGRRVTARARQQLANALRLQPTDVGSRVWHQRLEYSAVARVDDAHALPPRTLSIVMNDLADTPVMTMKGRGEFAVLIPPDIDCDILALRDLLNRTSGHAQGNYRFGTDGDANAANQAFFSSVLVDLATAGWNLWTRIMHHGDEGVDEEAEVALASILEPPGGTIQVAHILRDKVVPWAVIYDKPFDRGRRRHAGRPVEHVACSASLPDASGELEVTTCGTHPDCPLHPVRLAARDNAGQPTVIPSTVACPLGFWGVRHQIEIPPRQVDPGHEPIPAPPKIDAPAAARVLVGFNAGLATTESHRTELIDAMVRAKRGGPPAHSLVDRDDIVDALADRDLDMVYLYCHALGGEPTGPVPPRLEFADRDLPTPGAITPAELPRGAWSHHPFVVLNGCGTTGFSSHGTSQFVVELIDRRRAAAVLGADVPVAEVLAAEVGTHVVRAVLDGLPLGRAIQEARLRLLHRRNPLGLVYTLYGSVDLHLA